MNQTPPTKRRPIMLLVEDEPAVRRSLQLVLQGSGFTVRSYGSGATLLADPDASLADGLVADYRLPDGNGLSVLDGLRAAGFKGHAILITAFGSSDLAARAQQAGFDRVLEKPLADRVLRDAIAGLV
jgi:FixJ family two-component response regulator